jgi:hypothetical protein
MGRVRNPNFRAGRDRAKPALQAFLNGLPAGVEAVDFDAIRQAVPELAGEPDGVVHQAVLDAGFEVEI